MSHTYVELELSPAAYEEIVDKLRAAGYDHALFAREDGNGYTADMHGLAVVREPTYKER